MVLRVPGKIQPASNKPRLKMLAYIYENGSGSSVNENAASNHYRDVKEIHTRNRGRCGITGVPVALYPDRQ
jgi:hypothetical protein